MIFLMDSLLKKDVPLEELEKLKKTNKDYSTELKQQTHSHKKTFNKVIHWVKIASVIVVVAISITLIITYSTILVLNSITSNSVEPIKPFVFILFGSIIGAILQKLFGNR